MAFRGKMSGGRCSGDYTYLADRDFAWQTVGTSLRHLGITIERGSAWRLPVQPLRRRRSHDEPSPTPRPARCLIGDEVVHALPAALPFPDETFDRITCWDLLEFTRDDDLAARELLRVLRPGGRLTLRVPAAGPLAGLDALNLHHYLVDITRRGLRPWETAEIGWRRRYDLAELIALIGGNQVMVTRVERRRLGVGELADFAGRLAFRWQRRSPERYRAWRNRVERLESLEERLATPIGSVLIIEAVRRPA